MWQTAASIRNLVGIDGVILTKMDGDTRGGAALDRSRQLAANRSSMLVGEKLSDLEQFYPERMASGGF